MSPAVGVGLGWAEPGQGMEQSFTKLQIRL